MSQFKTKLLVAAIDFGTTFSGYAHSLKDEYLKDPLKIYANTNWTDGSGLVTTKAPTVVLFNPKGIFHSFGYDAETKYAQLSEDDEHEGWKYFRHFKMKLHYEVNLRRDMKLYDDQRNTMPAIDVFSASIKHLKDHLMTRLDDRILETDIGWVLTVPAIWHDGAKQFMREAANKAGIPNDQLTLALEPEAAAIYYKEMVVSKATEQGQSAQLQSFSPGAQFMVLDLGGGTVDITVHEVLDDGTLNELCPPSGGPWGGIEVDIVIYRFLDNLFGSNVMREFRKQTKTDDLDLQRTIELKKRTYKDIADVKVYLKLPAVLYELYEQMEGETFDKGLKKGVIKKRDRLLIENDIFLKMFTMSSYSLVNHVEQLLRKPKLRNVSTLMMVGGFSESEIMKNAVKVAFPNKTVIVPEQAGLAVVKGAVMYGHNTKSITSRRVPHTYGKSADEAFDKGRHPESKKVSKNGQDICEVFKVFIEKNTPVVPNETKVYHTFTASSIDTSIATLEIYRSDSKNPVYVSDDGCIRIGTLRFGLARNPKEKNPIIHVSILFGYTEIGVTANERGTNIIISASFDFLG